MERRYRKKPVTVRAWEIGSDSMPDWVAKAFNASVIEETNLLPGGEAVLEIETLEGTMIGNIGDYLIEGVEGELYPCKPGIFHATYEEVEYEK